jgi:hypothetical protein
MGIGPGGPGGGPPGEVAPSTAAAAGRGFPPLDLFLGMPPQAAIRCARGTRHRAGCRLWKRGVSGRSAANKRSFPTEAPSSTPRCRLTLPAADTIVERLGQERLHCAIDLSKILNRPLTITHAPFMRLNERAHAHG